MAYSRTWRTWRTCRYSKLFGATFIKLSSLVALQLSATKHWFKKQNKNVDLWRFVFWFIGRNWTIDDLADWNIAIPRFFWSFLLWLWASSPKSGETYKTYVSIILAGCFWILISHKFCCYNAISRDFSFKTNQFIQHLKIFGSWNCTIIELPKTVSI